MPSDYFVFVREYFFPKILKFFKILPLFWDVNFFFRFLPGLLGLGSTFCIINIIIMFRIDLNYLPPVCKTVFPFAHIDKLYVLAYNIFMKQIILYTSHNGRCYFEEWFESLDNSVKVRVIKRINQLEAGNCGDTKKLSPDLSELRLKFGSGYRIYYTETRKTMS